MGPRIGRLMGSSRAERASVRGMPLLAVPGPVGDRQRTAAVSSRPANAED